MRTYIILLLLVTGWTLSASAFVLEAYNGNVEFDHRFHRSKFECKECHEGPPAAMQFDRESAHKFCIGCHKRKGKGPMNHCGECHKPT